MDVSKDSLDLYLDINMLVRNNFGTIENISKEIYLSNILCIFN